MVRKSDRNKTKVAAPEKTPVAEKSTGRKSSRYSRRRKKSSSASESEDPAVAEPETVKEEQQPTPTDKKSDDDTTKRRHTRSHPRSSNSEHGLKLQGTDPEWKEDAEFWGANEETNQPNPTVPQPGKEEEEGGIWKVQNSNGSGGEIQKLKICRQRLTDATDSSSPSPSKESSPWRKRSGHHRRGEDEGLESPSSTPIDSEVTSSTGIDTLEQMDADSSSALVSEVDEKKSENVTDSETQEAEKGEESEDVVSSNPRTEDDSDGSSKKVDYPISIKSEVPDSSMRKSDDEGDKSDPEGDANAVANETTDSSQTKEKVEQTGLRADVSDSHEKVEKDQLEKTEFKENPDKTEREMEADSEKTVKESPTAVKETKQEGTSEGPVGDKLEETEKENHEDEEAQKTKETEELAKPPVFIRRNEITDEPGVVSRKRRVSSNKKKPEVLVPLEPPGPLISSQSLKLIVPDAKPITEEELDLQENCDKKKEQQAEDVLEVGELDIDDGDDKEEGEVDKPPVPPKRPKPITIERKVSIEKKEEPPRPQTKKTYITFETPKEAKKDTKEDKSKITVIRSDDRIKVPPIRKISVVPDTLKKVRSPSPLSKKVTEVLFITNLVRPFTVPQLRELLARTGTIAQNGFYIDKIKSKCYVKYIDVEMAIETRHALHGVRWPVNNPKTLKVEFASSEDMVAVQKLAENESLARTDPSEPGWLNEQSALKPARRVTAGVREWDVGKVNLMEAEAAEKENKVKEEWPKAKEREVAKRHSSPSPKDPPARKVKKKDTDTSALILSTLFRKTKVTPCIFWLPLTPAQIAAKVEMKKQQRAAEQERRLVDPKKPEQSRRDRDRDRDRERERRKK